MENSPISTTIFNKLSSTPRSKSLENLSSIVNSPELSSNLKQKLRKNKYDHIESKVKLYRQEIQNQQKMRKEKLIREAQESMALTQDSDKDEEICDNVKILKEKLKTTKEILKEKDLLITILNGRVSELLIKDANNQLKCDYMRIEITRLKSMLPNENLLIKSGTPLSIRNSSQFNVFKTPIRSISKTLLSPFRSITKSNPETVETDSSSDENDERERSLDNKTFVIDTNKLAPNHNQKDTSINSGEPLIGKNRNNRSKSKKMMANFIKCIKCTRNEEINDFCLPALHINNRIYPDIDVLSCLHSPTFDFKRTVSLDDSGKVKIPTVTIIQTPPVERTNKNMELNLRLSDKMCFD